MLNHNIRSLRQSKRISQVELANALGVSKQSVSNWENNNILPSIEMLVRIADYFQVTTDYLLDRDEGIKIDVTGLSAAETAHIRFIIEDIRK